MPLNAFRQQALAAALSPSRERGASGFRLHACAKSMLSFARALGWLISAFHKTEKRLPRDSRAATVRTSTALSISHWKLIVDPFDFAQNRPFIRRLPALQLFE